MGDLGSIPGLGRSPEEEKGYPLWYFGLENSMDCIVHGVTMSLTQLSDFHFHFSCWVLSDLFDCQDPLPMGLSRQDILEWVVIPFLRGSSYPGLNPCLLLGRQILLLPSHLVCKVLLEYNCAIYFCILYVYESVSALYIDSICVNF